MKARDGFAVKAFLTLFFLAFLGIGGGFFVLLGRSFVGAVRTYSWKERPCRILESSVAQVDTGWVFRVRYGYDAGGHTRESQTVKPAYKGSGQISDAQHLANRFPAGAAAVCFVDPAAPDKSCLVRPSLANGLLLLFPLVFLAAGAGGLFITWRRGPGSDPASNLSENEASPATGGGCLAVIFAVFLLAGLGFLAFFLKAAIRNVQAISWNEVPCVVIASAVREHPDNDGATYSVDILYEYEAAGHAHRSNRYQFLGGSSGGLDWKNAVVAENPPGTRRVCYVNPADPDDAVWTRSFGRDYVIVLVPVVFAGIGLFGIVFAFRAMRAKPVRARAPVRRGASTSGSRPGEGL